MTYHWIIPLVATLASLALAAFVLLAGPRTPIRRAFVTAAITLALWNTLYIIFYGVSDRGQAFEWSRIVRCGAMFLFPAVLHLTIVLPGRPRNRLLWRLLTVDYAIFFALAVANWLDLLVADLRVVDWGYYSEGTHLYNLFTLLVIVNFIGVLVLLLHEYRTTTEPRMRLQLKFWLVGMVIALPLGLTNLLPAYGIPFYPLGNLGSVAWAGIVAYAIVRHRLMDIEVVVSKSIAYLAVSLLIIGPAFAAGLLLQRWAFGEVQADFSAALLLLLLVMGTLFPAMRAWAEERVERSLFPRKQEHRATLSAFERSMIQILDRGRLIRELCGTVSDGFDLSRIALYMVEDLRGSFELEYSAGPEPIARVFAAEDPFVRWLTRRRGVIMRDEIEPMTLNTEGASPEGVFQRNEWDVCVALVSGGVLTGFLALGRRKQLRAFTSGDLEVLERLGVQASIAFENARLYNELRRSRDVINRAGRLSALGTLAAGIAHEIRNPLVSIQTFFQLAPERRDDEEFMTSFFRLAEEEVQRIGNLVSELLTFARSPTPTVRETDLEELIDRAITLLSPQARAQRVTLTRGDCSGLPHIIVDADQIMQVLINIVLNGIQATPAGGLVKVDCRTIDHDNTRYCQVEVWDTGPGVPQEQLEAIFNPFFTTKEKGTGLGLPIAHRVVAEAGGFITVESKQGMGTRFLIHLPIGTFAAADEPEGESGRRSSA